MAIRSPGYAYPAANVTVLNFPSAFNVGNFPATQAVTGTVNIGNLPATQPVSGSVSIANFPTAQPVSGSVSVVNFPATQPVSGSVSVANFPTSFQVSNFPATQPVSGTVNVGYFPASQTVTGTFWQATQPISATTLPLPQGAATSALQAQISGQFPTSLGAKATTASLSVTFATDQAALPIIRRGVANIATGQKSVAQAATLVIPANATRYNAVMTTSTTGAFYVGGAAVSPTTGLYIASGGYYTHESTAALYVYAASGTMTFTYLDEYA
jgi:hypothetical protein